MEELARYSVDNVDNYSESVDSIVKDLSFEFQKLWFELPTNFPKLEKSYTFSDKIKKERSLNSFTDEMAKLLQNVPEDEVSQEKFKINIMANIKSFMKTTLEFDDQLVDIIFSEGYTNVTDQFVREAKAFDETINVFDIFQAIRNVWIMNSIQLFLELNVEFTPSIFAYSMLYPYTDNYLDNPELSTEDKSNFNKRFRKRLKGELLMPKDDHEAAIYKLVSIIEEHYPRKAYKEVYEALIAIHNAQDLSLSQQRGSAMPYEKDILGISFEKGGSSVIADGYLVKPELTKAEGNFMFGYGVFLQLADDLQDVKEDYTNKHMTLFSQLSNKFSLDALANRLFHFMDYVLNEKTYFSKESIKNLRKLISVSCTFLIFEAIAKNKNLYTKKYIKALEAHFMFRFSYVKKLKKKLMKKYSKIDINNILKTLS